MDCVKYFPEMLQEVSDLMTEKELRVRLPLEELDVLLPRPSEAPSKTQEIKEDNDQSDDEESEPKPEKSKADAYASVNDYIASLGGSGP